MASAISQGTGSGRAVPGPLVPGWSAVRGPLVPGWSAVRGGAGAASTAGIARVAST